MVRAKIMANKIIAFDFLRALAIIMIIPAHLSNFLFSTYSKLGLYAFDPFFANMGLGLFIFMSGYLLYYNNPSINTYQDIFSFYKKRLLRIFPLYWAALIAFILIFSVFAPKLHSGFVFPNAQNVFTYYNILIHLLGLQIILAPAYSSPMLTLYFIGLIVAFYIVYPFITMFSRNSKQLLFVSSTLFFGFFLVSTIFDIIDVRFFMFFWIFVLGIFSCKEKLFEKSEEILKNNYVRILLAAFPIIFVIIVVLGSRTVLFLDPDVSLTVKSASGGKIESLMIISMLSHVANSLGLNYDVLKLVIDTILLNFFAMFFCILEYGFAVKIINDKLSYSISSLITNIATSSYCVYLFHRPFLALWDAGTNFIHNPILHDVTTIFVALPLLFFISYHLQSFEFDLKKYISNKKIHTKDIPIKSRG